MARTVRPIQRSTVNAKMEHANGKMTKRRSSMARPWLVTLANNFILVTHLTQIDKILVINKITYSVLSFLALQLLPIENFRYNFYQKGVSYVGDRFATSFYYLMSKTCHQHIWSQLSFTKIYVTSQI